MSLIGAGTLAAIALVLASPAAPALASASDRPAATKSRTEILEHYQGRIFKFDRNTWGGASDCAVMDASNVYCFDNNLEFNSFTDMQSLQASAASGLAPNTAAVTTCNGWAKIWDGPSYTNRGLAFRSTGKQYLGDYAPVPFNLRSWFTNGQRGLAPMTNCWGYLHDISGSRPLITLHTNSAALSLGPIGVYYIELIGGVN